MRVGGDEKLQLNARIRYPIALGPGRIIPVGQPLPAQSNVIHAMVPVVIFFSVLMAVLVGNWRQRVLGMACGLPFALILLLLTVPFQLVGLIEISIQQLAASLGLPRPMPLTLRWMILMEGGGRWALPIAAAVACAVVARNAERLWRHDESSPATAWLRRISGR